MVRLGSGVLTRMVVGVGIVGLGALVSSGCNSKDESIVGTNHSDGDSGGALPAGDDDGDPSGDPSDPVGSQPLPGASGSYTGVTGGEGGAGSVPSTRPTTSSSTPTVPVGNTAGGFCLADDDCISGMFCLQEDTNFFGTRGTEGSIAGGFCTARCETNSDACTAFGSLSTCIIDRSGTADDLTDDVGYCMEYCMVGDGREKCGGSFDQVCVPLTAEGEGACFPFCLDDQGCAEGQFCDPADGLCRATKAAGKDFGEVCAEDADCVGNFCLKVDPANDAEGLCSGSCAYFGLIAGCGTEIPEDPAEAPVPDALCLYTDPNGGPNDPGICLLTCDGNEDCKLDNLECSLFGADLQMSIGRGGLCVPRDGASGTPDGGAVVEADSGQAPAAPADGGRAQSSADDSAAPSADDDAQQDAAAAGGASGR